MKYKLNKRNVIENGKIYTTYGITAGSNRVFDISCNKQEVSELVSLFNHSRLSPIHFNNAVEDYLEACQ